MEQRRKSSNSLSRRRRSSDRQSPTNSLLTEGEDVTRDFSANTMDIDKPKINYQDELVLVFLHSMLDVIIEDWIPIPEEAPQVCVCEERRKKSSKLMSKNFKDLSLEDLEDFDVDIQGSVLSASEKRLSKGKSASKDIKPLKEQGKQKRKSKSSERSKSQEHTIERSKTSLKRRSKDYSKTEAVGSRTSFSYSVSYPSLDWLINPSDETVLIKFRNGNRYEGPVSKFLMHGFGKFTWADGAIYEGEFVNGYATGHGILQYSDLSTYHGTFCRSFLDGEGVLNLCNTTIVYSGCWKAGEKHGKGWLLYEPGNWYEGEWHEDNRQGMGLRHYKNGSKYQGKWHKGKRHGQGTMVWANNDIYMGEWKKGSIHGYGEYTWNAFLNKTFTFPAENIYQGTWVKGVREGIGIMNFGARNGSQLAGMWEKNMKHGLGVVICGNGRVYERNPLFWHDKPIHLEIEADPGYPILTPEYKQSAASVQVVPTDDKNISTFQLIVNQVRSKQEMENLESQVLNKIQDKTRCCSADCKSESDFLIGRDLCSPLHILLHSAPEKTDFSFFISKALQKYTFELYKQELGFEVSSCGKTEIYSSTVSKYSKWNLINFNSVSTCTKNIPTIGSSSDIQPRLVNFQIVQAQVEEKYLYQIIVLHLPNLHKLYDKYATLTAPRALNFKPVLIRLFLWQMLRDIKILDDKYSLTDIDITLIENPGSCLEYEHYPFERIYIWQFLQILMSLAWHVHSPSDVSLQCKTFGILPTIFAKFLNNIVYKHIGFAFSSSLFEYRDVLPIHSVYMLYRSLGEPHTARKFLKNVCTKKGQEPSHYFKVPVDEEIPKLDKGINAIPVGGNIVYLPNDPPNFGEAPSEPESQLQIDDPFRKELYVLRSLGPKKVIKCLAAVCPQIVKEGVIVNMDYPLTFVEFYDIFLMCGFTAVDKMKKQEARLKIRIAKELRQLSVVSRTDPLNKSIDKSLKTRERKRSKK